MKKHIAISTLSALSLFAGCYEQEEPEVGSEWIPISTASFCPTTGVTQCDSEADCSGDDHCTRSWNKDIEWMVGSSFGHCVDTNGQANAEAAIQADLCALPDPTDYSQGIPYNLPPNGLLDFGDHDSDGVALHVYRRTILEGNGAVIELQNPASASTELAGIRFIAGLETNGEDYAAPWENTNWSSGRDFTVRAKTNADSSMIGVLVQAHGVRLDNLRIQQLGTGIEIDGDSSQGNANYFQLSNLVLSGLWDYSIYIHGVDANGGYARGIETGSGVGIRDSSYLGNVWTAAASEVNDKVSGERGKKISFEFDGAANHTVATGLYLETGDAEPEVGSLSSIFLGGNIIRELGNRVDRVGYSRSKLHFRLNDPIADHDYKVTIPSSEGSSTAGAVFVQEAGEAYGWGLRIMNDFWGWRTEAAGVPAPFSWRSYHNWGSKATNHPDAAMGQISNRTTEVGNCSDGIDNDGDGDIDTDDSDC